MSTPSATPVAPSVAPAEVDPITSTILGLQTMYRDRRNHERATLADENRIRSYFLGAYAGDKDRAKEALKLALKGERPENPTIDEAEWALQWLAWWQEDISNIANHRKAAQHFKAQMSVLAIDLPGWRGDLEHIHGFGLDGFAQLVAEAGDLSNYPKKGHLWKRLGLGLVQAKPGEAFVAQRRSKDKKLAAIHGYSPRRRSAIWKIGDALFKCKGKNPEVAALYARRKSLELTKLPDAKGTGHAHKRACRYLEKWLVGRVRKAWRAHDGRRVAAAESGHTIDAVEARQVHDLCEEAQGHTLRAVAKDGLTSAAERPSQPPLCEEAQGHVVCAVAKDGLDLDAERPSQPQPWEGQGDQWRAADGMISAGQHVHVVQPSQPQSN